MSASAQSATASAERDLDEALAVLRERATEFARIPPRAKSALLRECIPRILDAAPAWVASGCKAKGISAREAGEEWLAGPIPTIRVARLLADTLDCIAKTGKPKLGTGTRTDDHDRLMVQAFPTSTLDKVMFSGFTGYALMQAGIDRAGARQRQAPFYRDRKPGGGVSLILGAGNVSSIPPLDVFTKMFNEGFVCLLKMNPVNEWAGPVLERALMPLIARGYLRVVYGGAAEGKYLVEHAEVDDVHITGSDRTHDMIVWGPPGAERDRRMAANEPLLDKPITSELGNVSPVAIVPYTYSDDQLWFQARNVVSMVANNGSFNCNAAKLLITSKHWAQREKFLSMVAKGLGEVPLRRAYYPGAFDRYETLVSGRERVEKFGHPTPGTLQWAFIRDVDSSDETDPIFRVEPFCGILSETTVGSADPVEFLNTVTEFLNERVWGTLNAAIVIHPKLESDSTVGASLQRAIRELRYGTVAINHWPALCYGVGSMPWGGHASVNLKDIQSGLGWVHNTFMLEGIDKSVIRGPIRVRPNPVWFYDHRKGHELGPRLAAMEANPRWRKLPSVMVKAL